MTQAVTRGAVWGTAGQHATALRGLPVSVRVAAAQRVSFGVSTWPVDRPPCAMSSDYAQTPGERQVQREEGEDRRCRVPERRSGVGGWLVEGAAEPSWRGDVWAEPNWPEKVRERGAGPPRGVPSPRDKAHTCAWPPGRGAHAGRAGRGSPPSPAGFNARPAGPRECGPGRPPRGHEGRVGARLWDRGPRVRAPGAGPARLPPPPTGPPARARPGPQPLPSRGGRPGASRRCGRGPGFLGLGAAILPLAVSLSNRPAAPHWLVGC